MNQRPIEWTIFSIRNDFTLKKQYLVILKFRLPQLWTPSTVLIKFKFDKTALSDSLADENTHVSFIISPVHMKRGSELDVYFVGWNR